MDIHAGIVTAAILVAIGALFVLRGGIRSIQVARQMTFYRLRQARIASGWTMLAFALFLFLIAIWLPLYGQPIAFTIYPPSPTIAPTLTPSMVPTMTVSPTITLTPTITDTPLVSDTPTATGTPYLLPAIEAQFVSIVTPNPEAAIGILQFSTTYNRKTATCVKPKDTFKNPITHMYACFTYDGMLPGAQWTAVWYRDGVYVFHETKPWDGATGGYGFSDWAAPADQWLSGLYSVQIFVGLEFKRGGTFAVTGAPPTATSTPTPSQTPSATAAP